MQSKFLDPSLIVLQMTNRLLSDRPMYFLLHWNSNKLKGYFIPPNFRKKYIYD